MFVPDILNTPRASNRQHPPRLHGIRLLRMAHPPGSPRCWVDISLGSQSCASTPPGFRPTGLTFGSDTGQHVERKDAVRYRLDGLAPSSDNPCAFSVKYTYLSFSYVLNAKLLIYRQVHFARLGGESRLESRF